MNKTFLETIKAIDGEVFNLSYHQKRYESVLESFGIKKFENLQEHLSPPLKGLYRCRLTYSIKKIEVTYHAYQKREVNSLKLVYDDAVEYCKKSTSREVLDKLFEKRAECSDILIVKND